MNIIHTFIYIDTIESTFKYHSGGKIIFSKLLLLTLAASQ